MPPAGKKPAAGKEDNFRARRLSVSDIDTSEFEKAKEGGATTTPAKPGAGGRARRMSMSPEMGVVKAKATLPFKLEAVGTYSCHGVEPGLRQGETSAKINQDRGCVVYPFGERPDGLYHQALFCVYDGHGALGDKVSHYTMNQVQQKLEEHANLDNDPAKALTETFISVDNALRADKSIDAELSGTTAVVVLLRQDKASKKMTAWSACAGDSRAVLCSVKKGKCDPKEDEKQDKGIVTDLTKDQKPDTPEEAARIKRAGGFISPPEEEWGGPARVWLDANMTLPGLAMARSIGDHLVSSVGVCAEPVVVQFNDDVLRSPDASSGTDFSSDGGLFMVLASDGVWEFIESHQACQLVHKFLADASTSHDSTLAVTKLIETAAAKWRQEEGDYRDDITAIVVRLRDLFGTGIEGSGA